MSACTHRLAGLLLLIMARVLSATEAGITMPEAVRQGDPCVVTILVPLDAVPQMGLLLPGHPSPMTLEAWPGGVRDGMALFTTVFAIPLETPPGQGSLSVSYLSPAAPPGEGAPPRSAQVMGKPFQVLKRSLKREEIALTSAMDSIKTAIDPLRDEQIRRYAAVLATPHPDAVYLDGPFVRPVSSQRYTAYFGDIRTYRYRDGSKETSQHWGTDFGVPTGTPVLAPARGRVVLAENRISTGWTIILEHLPGMFSIYMHLSALKVEPGQVVEARQLLAESGATGFATGPHLHWELRIGGVAVDPEALVGLPPGDQRFIP